MKFLERNNLLSLLPDLWKSVREIAEIQQVGETQADVINEFLGSAADDSFVASAGEEAIEHFEDELGLKPLSYKIAARRKRVAAMFAQPMALTKNNFLKLMNMNFGSGWGSVEEDDSHYRLSLSLKMYTIAEAETAIEYVLRTVPENIYVSAVNEAEEFGREKLKAAGVLTAEEYIEASDSGDAEVSLDVSTSYAGIITVEQFITI